MTQRERLSYSKMSRLVRCGEAYRREEIEREFPPPTSSMVRGTALHAVAAEGHLRQMKARQENSGAPKSVVLREALPTAEEAADLAATAFESERSRTGIVAPSDESDQPASKVIGRDKDTAVRMSRFYVQSVAPYIDPVHVERKITVEPKDQPISVVGVIDLEMVNEHGDTVIVDTKTGERRPNENAADVSDQLTMYALLKRAADGAKEVRVALNWIVSEKRPLSAPYKVTQESIRDESDMTVMAARINNAIEAVKAGAFLANGVGSWYCSPKWCRFHPTCPFVRQPK